MDKQGIPTLNCPYCNQEFLEAVAEGVFVLDGECPSSCDDSVVVRLRCPNCSRIAWAKTIAQSYATQIDWPEWVEIVEHPELPTEGNDEYWLIPQGNGTLLLREWGEERWIDVAIITSSDAHKE